MPEFLTRLLRKPSLAEVLARDLAEAQIDRAEMARLREYHAAMETMLKTRCERLCRELEVCTQKPTGEVPK